MSRISRRTVESVVAITAIVGLVLVLYNATLVDRRPPSLSRITLSATSAGDDHLAQTLTAIDLQFSEPVDRASVEDRVRLDPYVRGTFSWDGDAIAIFTPATKLPPDTDFSLSVAAGYLDRAGNAAPAPTTPFQFKTVGPPTVSSTTPAEGATGVATDTTVVLTFDRLMYTSSVEDAVTVQPAVRFKSTWTGVHLTLAFDTPLAFGTKYVVSVGPAAADTGGNRLEGGFAVSFTTVQAGLGIRSLVPADGRSGINVRTPIAVIFDSPIVPDTIQHALRITPPVSGNAAVLGLADEQPAPPSTGPGSATASPTGAETAGSVLVFTPSGPLAPHTTYTIELDPVVASALSSNLVAAGRTWSFTTGGPTTSAQNQIAFLSDRGGVRNVWLMNPDGSSPRQITSELVPVTDYDVAPDGRSVVYAAGGLVRRITIESGDPATMTNTAQFEYAPVISPDGMQALVGRRDAQGGDLGWWLVPLPGAPVGVTERQVLGSGAPPLGSVAVDVNGAGAGPSQGAWSRRAAFDPSGRWLLIADAAGQVIEIDLAPDGPATAPLIVAVSDPVGPPVWDAGTGSFLIEGTVAKDTSAAATGVVQVATDGQATLVFTGAGPVGVAAHGGIATLVAPDGTHVGYASTIGSQPMALTAAIDLFDRSPTFSPDGATMLFARVEASLPRVSAGIWLADLDGRNLRQLAPDGTDPRWLP